MFKIQPLETFPRREERILDFWNHENIFKLSLQQRHRGPLFSFYDGPPFATGLPHYGHLLAGTIKDVIPRFWSMKGYYVPRRFGWDCHGLPIENEIEQSQGLSGAASIEDFGIAQFNEECRKIVLRYTEQWQQTVRRMGRWVDFRETYKSMDKSFMESIWWVFGQLYEKGLIYEGFKVMPFSLRLGTPLSNFEANSNYREIHDPSVVVSFPLLDDPNVSLLAWTTTPWTLPSNLALAVHPDLDYVKIRDIVSGQNYILAEIRLKEHFKEYQILEKFKGKLLKNKRYEPLFLYFIDQSEQGAFRVIADPFVSAEDGTGIVHMAPAFGEADFEICQRENIDIVCPIDQNGYFTSEVPDFQGLFIKAADKEILRSIKNRGRLVSHGQIYHRYPFCWRTDTPLIYKAVQTWFVNVEILKEALLEANKKIHWVPSHIKEGRFGKWLENARDWAISRNRYWGTPIPLWRSDDGDIRVISSVKELEEKTGKEILDLHRHFIDHLTFEENGKTFRRIPEVFDCWFESGSMPYAQNHFPFERQEETMKAFPADFIGEGLDQTRGWFYTLTVLAVALFNRPAFKNVVVNGIILAEDGTKMSKRLKNYPEPSVVLNKYGADAIRLYLLNSVAVAAEDMRFSAKGVEQTLKHYLIPLWNAYVFFATYAKISNWKPKQNPIEEKPPALIDQWILSTLQSLIQEVEQAMQAYQLQQAVSPLATFVDHLTDWYIRRNRQRFWAEEFSSDQNQAFETLYHVLMTYIRIMAPFAPFLTEAIYLELRTSQDPISVHLCDFPVYQKNLRNLDLENHMQEVQLVVRMGHALRKEHKLKVRQPLAKAHIICRSTEKLKILQQYQILIAEELNVKEMIFSQNETDFVTLQAKPNFRELGKKVGPLMNLVQKQVSDLSFEQLQKVLDGESVILSLQGQPLVLTSNEIIIERKIKDNTVANTEKDITLALNTILNQELILEGIARELVNKINTLRRSIGLEVTDRIHVKIQTHDPVVQAFSLHRNYICHEVLATSFLFEPCQGETVDINGVETNIFIQKSI